MFDLRQLRNKASNLCVDTRYKGSNERFQLETCVKDGGSGGEQVGLNFLVADSFSPFNLFICSSHCFCPLPVQGLWKFQAWKGPGIILKSQ